MSSLIFLIYLVHYLLIIQKSWEDKITPGESFNLGPMEDKEINVKDLCFNYMWKDEGKVDPIYGKFFITNGKYLTTKVNLV